MSQENVEIVRAGYEAFGRGDLTAMFGAVSPEIVTYTVAPLPDPAEYEGMDGMIEWIGGWTQEFGEFELVVEDFIDRRDYVIARIRQKGTGARSGIPVERVFWFLHELHDGRIVRMGVHPTETDALRSAETLTD